MSAEFKEKEASVPALHLFTGLNTGSFTWNITDSSTITNILSASNQQLFESDPFTMAGLQWTLKLYPNGDEKGREGIVDVLLKLESMPPELVSIVCSRVTSCNQTFGCSY